MSGKKFGTSGLEIFWQRLSWSLGISTAIALSSSAGLTGLSQESRPAPVPPVTPGSTVAPQPGDPTQARFSCQFTNGQYTVVYHPESRPGEAFPWATPGLMGGGWTPELRCNEISRRLEEYRPDGLIEMRTGQENGYNIVCVTTQNNGNCRIVFTVPPGQDPLTTRDLVFQNLAVADSGQNTQAVNTFVNAGGDPVEELVNFGLSILGDRRPHSSSPRSSQAIRLKPYLDPADGGTGKALKQGIPLRPRNPQLNPAKFR